MVNNFPKYPSIKRIGHPKTNGVLEGDEVLVQEKMDGSNFRFTYNGEGIIFGSRNSVRNADTPLTPEDIGNHPIQGQFEGVVDYVLEKIDWSNIDMFKGDVFFGENMYPHTIEYDFESVPRFLGFDVYNVEKESYVDPDTSFEIFENLNLPRIPILERISVSDFDPSEYEIPESQYRNGNPEGIIMTNPEGYPSHRPVKAKRWTEEFAEKHKSGSNPCNESPDNDTDKFVAQYITKQRIKKHAHKLIEEGKWEALQMEMMEDLPMRVIEDAWEEEYETVIRENLEIDMGDMRSTASSKCATILNQMIMESA